MLKTVKPGQVWRKSGGKWRDVIMVLSEPDGGLVSALPGWPSDGAEPRQVALSAFDGRELDEDLMFDTSAWFRDVAALHELTVKMSLDDRYRVAVPGGKYAKRDAIGRAIETLAAADPGAWEYDHRGPIDYDRIRSLLGEAMSAPRKPADGGL